MSQPRVILFGGFTGWFNFGDFAQLKSWLIFYNSLGFRCYVVLNKSCLFNKLQYDLLKECFGSYLIYYQDKKFYDSELNLIEYDEFDIFHVYGGGFLNLFWGRSVLEIIEETLNFFKPKKYFITGQQISKDFIPYLKKHINIYKPDILAVRDKETLDFCSELKTPVLFSFDDSVEYFSYVKNHLNIDKNLKKNASTLLLHLNLSYYVLNNENEIWEYRNILKNLIKQYNRLCLIKAYQSYDNLIKDTFRAIDYIFLTKEKTYGIYLDLMAIILNEDFNSLNEVLNSSSKILAVSNSYHTALFFSFLGIPSCLIRLNPYYKQKGKLIFEDYDVNNVSHKLAEMREEQQKKLLSLLNERKEFIIKLNNRIRTEKTNEFKNYGKFTYESIEMRQHGQNEIDPYLKLLINDIYSFRKQIEICRYHSNRLLNKINLLQNEIETLRFHRDELKLTLDRIYMSRGWRLLNFYYKIKHAILLRLGILKNEY